MIKYSHITSLVTSCSLLLGGLVAKGQSNDISLHAQFVAMCAATNTTTVPASSWTIINFNYKEADTANAVTVGTSWNFKVPEDAYLDVRTSVRWSSVTPAAGNYDSIAVFKNGSYLKMLAFDYEWVALGYPISATMGGSTIVRASKDDTIDIRVWHQGASSGTTTSAPQESWVTISRIK